MSCLEQWRTLLATSEKNFSHINWKGQLISTAKVNWDSSLLFCCCMVQIWDFILGFSQTSPVAYVFICLYLCRHSPDTCASPHTPACTSGRHFLPQGTWKVWLPTSVAFTSPVRLQLNTRRRQGEMWQQHRQNECVSSHSFASCGPWTPQVRGNCWVTKQLKRMGGIPSTVSLHQLLIWILTEFPGEQLWKNSAHSSTHRLNFCNFVYYCEFRIKS